MKIHGIEFDFSTLNADDVDRMTAASERYKLRAQTEGANYTLEGDGYSEGIRFLCRIFTGFLDEVLGEGASEKLGLTGSNYNKCLEISKEFTEAMAAEKASATDLLHPNSATEKPALAPQNRAQRRQKKHKPHSRSEGFHPAVVTQQKTTPETDGKAALRKMLLKELAALDND